MTPEERREIAEKVMGWIPPLPLPEGNYTSEHSEDDPMCLGPIIGYRHNKSGKFYTLKEFIKYEYWTNSNGDPVKAPWGGLVSIDSYYKNWAPDLDANQALMVIERMRELGFGLELLTGPGGTRARFAKTKEEFGAGGVWNNDILTAICQATLAAVKESE